MNKYFTCEGSWDHFKLAWDLYVCVQLVFFPYSRTFLLGPAMSYIISCINNSLTDVAQWNIKRQLKRSHVFLCEHPGTVSAFLWNRMDSRGNSPKDCSCSVQPWLLPESQGKKQVIHSASLRAAEEACIHLASISTSGPQPTPIKVKLIILISFVSI